MMKRFQNPAGLAGVLASAPNSFAVEQQSQRHRPQAVESAAMTLGGR